MDKLVSFVSCAWTAGQSSGVIFFLSSLFVVSAHRAHGGTFTIFSSSRFLSNTKYGQFHEPLVAHRWIPMHAEPILIIFIFDFGCKESWRKMCTEYTNDVARSHIQFGLSTVTSKRWSGLSEIIEWYEWMNVECAAWIASTFQNDWISVNTALWVNNEIGFVDRLLSV